MKLDRNGVIKALYKCNGNLSETARELQVTPSAVRYQMLKHGIDVHWIAVITRDGEEVQRTDQPYKPPQQQIFKGFK